MKTLQMILFFAFFAGYFTSCKKQPKADLTQNNGAEVDSNSSSNLPVLIYKCDIPDFIQGHYQIETKMGTEHGDKRELYIYCHKLGWEGAMHSYLGRRFPIVSMQGTERSIDRQSKYTDIGSKQAGLLIMQLELMYSREEIQGAIRTYFAR